MNKHTTFFKTVLFSFLIVFSQLSLALGSKELLPPDLAFKVTARAASGTELIVSWEIADGYYLYRSKTHVQSLSDNIQLGSAVFPDGIAKHDDFFGDMEIYRGQLQVKVPVDNTKNLSELTIQVNYQGCADIGICYPPLQKKLTLSLPHQNDAIPSSPLTQWVNNLQGLKLNLFQDTLLPAKQAFQFFASVKDAHSLHVNWLIADGYYLYRSKTKLSVTDEDKVELNDFNIPTGEPYHDEAFGQVQIFHNSLEFDVPLIRLSKLPQTINLTANYQGCADRGVCYPPMESTVQLQLPATQQLINTATPTPSVTLSEQDEIFNALKNDSFALTLLSFFGFGLLLAFTPCIFPMIPILSGIIVGQGESVTTRKAFLLSLSYVIASALTYTVFGILAALFGSNLQVIFQEPWIIALFSVIFILLSLSMFGFYNLELPKSIQAKLHDSSDKHRDGSYLGAAIMGALSALIVGPCVAAPLAGALIYIGQTGDMLLGGSALFVMGFAMGSPLLLLGASAGSLLPKAGHWLNSTKAIFGVIMLAVSVWMLDRILPAWITLLLISALLIIPSIYLRAVDPLPENASGWQKLWKGLGLMMLIYGVLLLISLSMGNTNPLQPLRSISMSKGIAKTEQSGLNFQRISSVDDLTRVLERAAAKNQWVMLDFYADWCISCKEMEAYTFTDDKVKQRLSNFILIQADVTKNSVDDQALLKKFTLIGPPAIIFFGPDRKERPDARVIGYQDTDTFLSTINKLQ